MEFTYEKTDELYHHGILGQKWGVRRYQNEDGSVTPAGAKRYYDNGGKKAESLQVKANRNRLMANMNAAAANSGHGLISKANSLNAQYYANRSDKLQKKADEEAAKTKYKIAKQDAKEAGKKTARYEWNEDWNANTKSKLQKDYLDKDATAKEAKYEYERAKSIREGKVTKGFEKAAFQKMYDMKYSELYDKNSAADSDRVHERAKSYASEATKMSVKELSDSLRHTGKSYVQRIENVGQSVGIIKSATDKGKDFVSKAKESTSKGGNS